MELFTAEKSRNLVIAISLLIVILGFLTMFGWSKKYSDIRTYPNTWGVGQGEINGKPLFVRFRAGFKEAAGHPDYPFQIGVAVPLNNPTDEGLTTDQEADELFKIEELLEQTLANEGVFALAITTNGMREFVFYVKEWKPEVLEKIVKSIDSGSHEIQFMIQHDPKWETFKRFAK